MRICFRDRFNNRIYFVIFNLDSIFFNGIKIFECFILLFWCYFNLYDMY